MNRNTKHFLAKRRSEGGFTLVELLVVIAIISILVLMLLPAINAARESARKATCINKMSQLILSVHNYEMSNEAFPMGTTNPTSPVFSQEKGMHHNWIMQILPYMEEGNLYDTIDFSTSVYSKQNKAARAMTLSAVVCPSDWVGIHVSSYAGSHHDVEAQIDENNNGVFILNKRITRDDIPDGLRHTIFIGEKVADGAGEFGWMSGTRSTLRNTGIRINGQLAGAAKGFYEVDYSITDVSELIDDEEKAEEASGADEESSSEEITSSTQTEQPEGDISENSDDEVSGDGAAEAASDDSADDDEGESTPVPLDPNIAKAISSGAYVGGFGSRHSGGAIMAFGDGNVRFLSESIDLKTLQQLGNRRDRQVVDHQEL